MSMTFRHLFAIAACLATLGCDGSSQAGTAGSEAGNAIVLEIRDGTGAPVGSARVQLRPMGSEDASASIEGSTGTDGRIRLDLPPGNWSALSRKGDLASWSILDPFDTLVIDTLRPTAIVSGHLEGAGGARIALPGLGVAVTCDGDGYFQIPSLPSGLLPVVVGTSAAPVSHIQVEAGVDALVLDEGAGLPSVWPTLPADSLVPWASLPTPGMLPRAALGDTGMFSVAIRLRRTDSVTRLVAVDWTDDSGNGVQIGWRGRDTMVLRLDGIPYRVSGFALSPGWEQVGLSWDGHRLAVVRGTDSVLTLTTTSPTDRSSWGEPRFGSIGTSRIQWIAFQRGGEIDHWLRRLALLANPP